MGHKSVNPVCFFLKIGSLRSPDIGEIIFYLCILRVFFTVYLSKHHPSQHVVASCIHDIQIHLSQVWRKNVAGGRARLPDTILEEDHPIAILSKFGSN